MATPSGSCLVVGVALSAFAYTSARQTTSQMPAHANPAELRSALVFGVLYAIVLLAVAAARQNFGAKGLYVVAALSD